MHENVERRSIIIHYQRRQGAKPFGNDSASRRARSYTHRHGKQERAASAWFALEPYLATHQFHQPPGNRQPEPSASMLACRGRVGLGERLKQSCSLFGRHADARILDREPELGPGAYLFQQFRFQVDLALLSKLDGIVDQVRDYLAQPQGIADQILGNRSWNLSQKLQPLLLGPLSSDGGHGANYFIQAEFHCLDIKPPRLDLRKVEDVIDYPQQRGPGIMNLVEV